MTAAPAPSTAPSKRPRRRGRRTAERILDAAEALFAERGYAGTTLRDVAARVGVRNPSLYNHFESKDSLYEAVLERGLAPLLEALDDFAASGADSSLDSDRLIERVMYLLAQRPSLVRLVQHETLAGGERLLPLLSGHVAAALSRARQLVEATPAAAKWSPEQIPRLVLAMFHIVAGYFTSAPLYLELTGEDPTRERAVREQTRFLGAVARALFFSEESNKE